MLVPLYRLRNNSEHFYTTDPVERDNAVSQYGYVAEGIACYVLSSPDPPDDQVRDQLALSICMSIVQTRVRSARYSTAYMKSDVDLAYRYADEMMTRRVSEY